MTTKRLEVRPSCDFLEIPLALAVAALFLPATRSFKRFSVSCMASAKSLQVLKFEQLRRCLPPVWEHLPAQSVHAAAHCMGTLKAC